MRCPACFTGGLLGARLRGPKGAKAAKAAKCCTWPPLGQYGDEPLRGSSSRGSESRGHMPKNCEAAENAETAEAAK
jgi:hypothetical protein